MNCVPVSDTTRSLIIWSLSLPAWGATSHLPLHWGPRSPGGGWGWEEERGSSTLRSSFSSRPSHRWPWRPQPHRSPKLFPLPTTRTAPHPGEGGDRRAVARPPASWGQTPWLGAGSAADPQPDSEWRLQGAHRGRHSLLRLRGLPASRGTQGLISQEPNQCLPSEATGVSLR